MTTTDGGIIQFTRPARRTTPARRWPDGRQKKITTTVQEDTTEWTTEGSTESNADFRTPPNTPDDSTNTE